MFLQLLQDLDFNRSPQTCSLLTAVNVYGDFIEGLGSWRERQLLIIGRVTAKLYKIHSEMILKSGINNNKN